MLWFTKISKLKKKVNKLEAESFNNFVLKGCYRMLAIKLKEENDYLNEQIKYLQTIIDYQDFYILQLEGKVPTQE